MSKNGRSLTGVTRLRLGFAPVALVYASREPSPITISTEVQLGGDMVRIAAQASTTQTFDRLRTLQRQVQSLQRQFSAA